MNKTHALLIALFINTVLVVKVNACVSSVEAEEITPVTFDCLYPTPFYNTGIFKWSVIIAVSVGVAAATVATFGAAAVPGATTIGGLLGSTWTAGLATLGGGTLASGGFGMAGGAFVIALTTDLALVGLIESTPIPQNNIQGKDYSYIKIPLPKQGSKPVLKIYKKIADQTENFHDIAKNYADTGNDEQKRQEYKDKYKEYITEIRKQYIDALNNKINPSKTRYDLINGAILTYNLGMYKKSQTYLDEATEFFPDSSYIYYHQALLNLVEGSTEKALENIIKAIDLEPDALNPYLIGIQVALDTQQYSQATEMIKSGLKEYDEDNFQLNYLGGLAHFYSEYYQKAIIYFREALRNVTIDEIEADTKLWIAKSCQMIAESYQKSGDEEKAKSWYKKETLWFEAGIDQVDNKMRKEVLKKQYERFGRDNQ